MPPFGYVLYRFSFRTFLCVPNKRRRDLQGLRAQIDRTLYKKHMQALLTSYPNLEIRAASVHDLIWTPPESSYASSSSSSPNVWAKVGGVRLGKKFIPSNEIINLNIFSPLSDTGEEISCPSVVLCTGTFLSGEIHIGWSSHVVFFV